jgi:cytochrome b pre-mRNA-processing protein 3
MESVRLMSLLTRLLRPQADPREALRPLWHRTVEVSREAEWYRDGAVADTVAGRFDMIAAILALVLLRLEPEEETDGAQVYLTELFVEDMDGQLRESGVGDLVVGKHIGKLVSALGGRLGAFREALAANDDAAWHDALVRNVSLRDGADPAELGKRLRTLVSQLAALPTAALLRADWTR